MVSSVRIVARDVPRSAIADKLGIFASCGVLASLEVGVPLTDNSKDWPLALVSSIRGTGGVAWLFLSRFPENKPLILSSTKRLLECDLGACGRVSHLK